MEEERREELNKEKEGRKKRKGLKQLVKSCVGGGGCSDIESTKCGSSSIHSGGHCT
ncbi:hypothetical protein Sjap_002378 [Stephania japonica]|uniref:Uncharacterized protein n=1 Tax=Stephania japonica TaxID=461633 RepID=A0AAP0PSG9_9MAGN